MCISHLVQYGTYKDAEGQVNVFPPVRKQGPGPTPSLARVLRGALLREPDPDGQEVSPESRLWGRTKDREWL